METEAYVGYKVECPTDEQLARFYSGDMTENIFSCAENEYVLFRQLDAYNTIDNSSVFDKYKWTGKKYEKVKYRMIDNEFSGKIKPRNPQQSLAFDLLQDEKTTVKMLTGTYGSGKTMLMVVHALDLIEKGKFDKLVWVRNNIEVKDTAGLGFLPGTQMEKMMPWAGPLIDHVGGQEALEILIEQGKIEVQHLGFIRGRDIKNSIIISTEAENLTKQHVQLLIGRVGEGSQLWLDGDHRQVDKQIFKDNSGLAMAAERLRGNRLFGYVDMPHSERSETARLADLLD